MARLIYGMITSLDGYIEDTRGSFGWGAAEDEAVHAYINLLASCPVVVGGGKRVFPDDVRLDLTLLEARRFDGGVAVLRYDVRG